MDILFPNLLAPLLASGIVAAIIAGAIVIVRWDAQVVADRKHSTYELRFPAEMNMDNVHGALRAIAGLDKQGFLAPAHTLSMEHYADPDDPEGIERHFLHIPGHQRERVDSWLQSQLDVDVDIIQPHDDPVRNTNWLAGVELGMTGGPLQIVDSVIDSTNVSFRFDHLKSGEKLVTQLTFHPAEKRRPTPDTKEKETTNTFHANIKVGAVGEDPKLMIQEVLSGYSTVEHQGAHFYKRWMRGVPGRINRRAGTMGFLIYVNEDEIAVLSGWPLGGSTVVKARRLIPTASHDTEGIIIGESNSPRARGRKVAMPVSALATHVYVTGPSGSGKTILLQNLTLGAITAGLGAFVFDPKGGDLVRGILRSIPDSRKDDVIWWDPMDNVAAIGFNPLKGDPEQVASHMTSVMHILFRDSWGPRLEMYIKSIFTTAAAAELTMYDCYMMLINDDYRKQVLRKVSPKLHPDDRAFWDLYERGSELAKDTVINKLHKIVVSSVGRRVFSQQDGLDMADIMRKRQILLVPMNMAEVGESNEAVGLLSQEMIINAAMRRTEAEAQDIHLLVQDEYQHFAGVSTNKFEPWAEVRSKGLGLIAANQYTRQLPKSVQETIGVNAATKIANRAGDLEDAKELAANFAPLKAEDLLHLPKYTVAARIMSSGGVAPVVTLNAPPPPGLTGLQNYIVERSRRLYGTPVAQLEAAIEARHRKPEPKNLPDIRRSSKP